VITGHAVHARRLQARAAEDVAAADDDADLHAGRLHFDDLARDNRIPLRIYDMSVEGDLMRIMRGEKIGTLVS
jgi:uridylate kinase